MDPMNPPTNYAGIDQFIAQDLAKRKGELLSSGVLEGTPQFSSELQKQRDLTTDKAYKDQVKFTKAKTVEKYGVDEFSDELDDFAHLRADQFTKRMKPVTWDDFKKNRRSPAGEFVQDGLSNLYLGLEGAAASLAGSVARLQMDAMGVLLPTMPLGLSSVEKDKLQRGVETSAKEGIRTVAPSVTNDWLGSDVDAPVLPSEKYGQGKSGYAGEVLGQALSSLPMSAPSMLAKDPVTSAVVLLPFAAVGYGEGAKERMDIWRDQVQLAQMSGTALPPPPSNAEVAGYAAIKGGAEYISEYTGDFAQHIGLGVLGFKYGRGRNPTRVKQFIDEWLSSVNRRHGPIGTVKTAGVVAYTGAVEGAEEIAPELVKKYVLNPMAGKEGSGKFWDEETKQAAIVGTTAGVLLGGAATGYSEFVQRREGNRLLREGGIETIVGSLERSSMQDAQRRLAGNEPSGKSTPKNPQPNVSLTRRSNLARSSAMAMDQIEQVSSLQRGAVMIHERDAKTAFTKDVRTQMRGLGISTKPIANINGINFYVKEGMQDEGMAAVENGDYRWITGMPDMLTSNLVVGAMVIRDKSGQIVEVHPYSDSDTANAIEPSVSQAAAKQGNTVKLVDGNEALTIADELQQQADADAELQGLAPSEQRPSVKGDRKRGISALRLDINRDASGTKGRASPSKPFTSAYLSKEEIGGALNKDVRVTTSIFEVPAAKLSEDEARLGKQTGINPTILDGAVTFSLPDGKGGTKTITKPIRMDGAYVSQTSPDGVFLVRENGTALTRNNAQAVAFHEANRHRPLARSRAGSEFLRKVLMLDPVLAMRGGSEYMRRRDATLANMSDAQIVAHMRGLWRGAIAATTNQSSTPEQLAQAQADFAKVRMFSEEAGANAATNVTGTALTMAVDFDSVHKDAVDRGHRSFAYWMANVMVTNGFFGKNAKQLLFETQQRMNGIREEELKIHKDYSAEIEIRAKRAFQSAQNEALSAAVQNQKGSTKPTPSAASKAAPAAAPAGAPAAPAPAAKPAQQAPQTQPAPAQTGIPLPPQGQLPPIDIVPPASMFSNRRAAVSAQPPEEKEIKEATDAINAAAKDPSRIAEIMATAAPSVLKVIEMLGLAQASANLPPVISGGNRSSTRNIPPELRQTSPVDLPSVPVDVSNRGAEDEAVAQRILNQPQGDGESVESALMSDFDIAFSMRGQEEKPKRGDARGEKQMISRLQQEYSRRDMPVENVKFATDLITRMGGVDETKLRILSPKNMRAATGTKGDVSSSGFYAFHSDIIGISTAALNAESFKETFGHEFWHAMEKHLDDSRIESMVDDFDNGHAKFVKKYGADPRDFTKQRKQDDFLKKVDAQGLETKDWYKFINEDEWIVANLVDPTLERMELSESTKDVFGMGRLLLRNTLTSIKQVFGQGKYDAIAREFLEQGVPENVDAINPLATAERRIKAIRKESRNKAGLERENIRADAQSSAMSPMEAQFSLRPIGSQEMTPAMQIWSKGSKAADESGALIPLYHGTEAKEDFKEFKAGKFGNYGTGIYLADEPDTANKFAGETENSRVVPAVASIKNPFVYEEFNSNRSFMESVADTSGLTGEPLDKLVDELRRGDKSAQSLLEGAGYDGVHVIAPNGKDILGRSRGNYWLAYRPNQVKGYYNANPTAGPEIMNSVRKTPEEKAAEAAARVVAKTDAKAAAAVKSKGMAARMSAIGRDKSIVSPFPTAAPMFVGFKDPSLNNTSETETRMRMAHRVKSLLGNNSDFLSAVKQIANAANAKIGSIQTIKGAFEGALEETFRIGWVNTSNDDIKQLTKVLGSLFMQKAAISIIATTPTTPAADKSHFIVIHSKDGKAIPSAALDALLLETDVALGGSSAVPERNAVYAGHFNGLTVDDWNATAEAIAAKYGLGVAVGEAVSDYNEIGGYDVLGRTQRVVQKAGAENAVSIGSANDWDLWVNAASQVAAIADEEGIVVDHRQWVGQIESDPAIADEVTRRLIAATDALIAERSGHGLEPRLLTKFKGSGIGLNQEGDAAIGASSTLLTVDAQISAIDPLLAKHPDAMVTENGTARFLVDLFGSRTIPVLAMDHIKRIANGFAGEIERFKKITAKQVAASVHGLTSASQLADLYMRGMVSPKHTILLAAWGFMSRGVSPSVQESLWLDITNFKSKDGTEFPYFADHCVNGTWNSAVGAEWDKWIGAMFAQNGYYPLDANGNKIIVRAKDKAGKPIPNTQVDLFVNGSIGAGATHNANAFGEFFMANMGKQVTIGGKTQSGIQHFHDALSDTNVSGAQVRRIFHRLGGGMGIDNKVVSFISLLAGKTDVMVMDRVAINDGWNNEGQHGTGFYDGRTVGIRFVVNKPVGQAAAGEKQVFERTEVGFMPMPASSAQVETERKRLADQLGLEVTSVKKGVSGFAPVFDDVRGAAIYEAIERTIDPQKIFSEMVKAHPSFIPFATKGGYHWMRWVLASQQEASHATIDALINMINTGGNTAIGTFAREGRFDTFGYGVQYGHAQKPDGTVGQVYRYSLDKQIFDFTPQGWHDALDEMQSRGSGVIPVGFKVTEADPSTLDPTVPVPLDASGMPMKPTRDKPWVDDARVNRAALATVLGKHAYAQTASQFSMRKISQFQTIKQIDAEEMLVNENKIRQLVAVNERQALLMRDVLVDARRPKPDTDGFAFFDKGNRLNEIVPNDIWFHSGNSRFVSFDGDKIKSDQLGFHAGRWEASKQFFDDHKKTSSNRKTPTMYPLYISAYNPLELPDMGTWDVMDVLRGALIVKRINYDKFATEKKRYFDWVDKLTNSNFEEAFSDIGLPMPPNGDMQRTLGRAHLRYSQDILERLGHDAVTYQNYAEGIDRSPSLRRQWQSMFDQEWAANDDTRGLSPIDRYRIPAALAAHREVYGDNTSVVVWNPNRLKSAVAGTGDFDLTDSRIPFSMRNDSKRIYSFGESNSPFFKQYREDLSPDTEAAFSVRTGILGAKDETVLNYIDRFGELKRMGEEAAPNFGGNLPDTHNPYQGARILGGRIAAMQLEAERNYADVMRDQAEHGIAVDEMDQFLYAQHALNGGNQYIAEINTDPATGISTVPDGGTGMTNIAAGNIIAAENASGRYGQMNRIAERWRAMLRQGLALRLQNGLINQETFDRLTTRYTHYVPLQGAPNRPFDELFEEEGTATGRGISTQGRGMPQRTGRRSAAENITSQVGFVFEDTLRRVARNEVGQQFLNLVQNVNDNAWAQVIPTPMRSVVSNGRVRRVADRSWMDEPRNFGVYADRPMTINGNNYEAGDMVIIQINNPRLQQNLTSPNMPLRPFERALQVANNSWRFMTTGPANPVFAVTNMIKDFQNGILTNNALQGGRSSVGMAAKWVPSWINVFHDAWFERQPRVGSMYARFVDAGGQMINWKENDIEIKNLDFDAIAARVARRDPNDRGLARTLLGWYPAFFTAAETATRVAAFAQRVSEGASDPQAGLYARDINVDFGKGGLRKSVMNTKYVFINAGIQGTVNIGNAVNRNKGFALSVVGLGYLMGAMARAMGGKDDETGRDNYDNIPEHDKSGSMIFMDPRASGKYLKLPLSYGWNALYSAGVRLADSTMGPKSTSDLVVGMVNDALNAFNPMGGSGVTSQGIQGILTTAAPTFVRPLFEVGMNQNWMGRPIRPQGTTDGMPMSYKYFDGTPQWAISASQGLNSLFGGDEFENGLGSFEDLASPNSLQYLAGFYFSGAGRNIERLYTAATNPEETDISGIPLARVFVGDSSTDTRYLSETMYGIKDDLAGEMNRYKAMARGTATEEQQAEILARGLDENKIQLGLQIDMVDKQLKKIRTAMKTATPMERRELVKDRAALMKSVIRSANDLQLDR
jgi:hypothetical protein